MPTHPAACLLAPKLYWAAAALQPGLLSQAFRGGSSRAAFGRAISLSNLLDAPAEHTGLFGSLGSSTLGGSSSSLSKRPAGSGDSTPTAAAAAAAGGPFDEVEGRKQRKKQPPQWGSKNNVIELLNELIDELDGIEQQIAQQAVEHIHANEVSPLSYASSICSRHFVSHTRHAQIRHVHGMLAAAQFADCLPVCLPACLPVCLTVCLHR